MGSIPTTGACGSRGRDSGLISLMSGFNSLTRHSDRSGDHEGFIRLPARFETSCRDSFNRKAPTMRNSFESFVPYKGAEDRHVPRHLEDRSSELLAAMADRSRKARERAQSR